MNARLQRRVQRYGWDKAATHYERTWQTQLEPAQTALLDMAKLVPVEGVLDIARGTGLVSLRAARLVAPAGVVQGADISDEMTTIARQRACTQGITNCRFERMDAGQLAIESESIDVALCALGLMYVPDPEQAIAELRRVLRPGGRAVTTVWRDGLSCEVSGPAAEHAITDMPQPMGGQGAGANPGWLLRAGIASCAATAIAMRAAMTGIALRTLEVTVESESDARGLVGIPDASTALDKLRMSVRIGAVRCGEVW